MEDYDKMLKESIPSLNKTMLQEQIGTVTHNQLNMSANNSSISLKKKFMNPLLSSTEGIQNTSGNMESILEGPEQLPTWNSQGLNSMQMSGKYTSFPSPNQSKIFTLDNSIKMNEKFLTSSVKVHLDSILDQTNEDPEKVAKLNNSTVFNSNFLKKRHLNEVRGLNTVGTDFSSINKFTNQLASGQFEQRKSTSPGNASSIHFKPSKQSMKRELGLQIVNTKLPRSRKYVHTVDEDSQFFKI